MLYRVVAYIYHYELVLDLHGVVNVRLPAVKLLNVYAVHSVAVVYGQVAYKSGVVRARVIYRHALLNVYRAVGVYVVYGVEA